MFSYLDNNHQDAEHGTFHTMWNFMDANPEVFTASNEEGIERVKGSGGKYAFFMESSSIEYIMERHCDLAKVGGELDAKSYGIGGLPSQSNPRHGVWSDEHRVYSSFVFG